MVDLAIFMALFICLSISADLAGRKGRIYYSLIGIYYTLVVCQSDPANRLGFCDYW